MSGSIQRPRFAIEASKLTKTYAASGKMPKKQALKGIDLQIASGSIFGLLGPNGAGKSTFINILAGLVTKSTGQVSIWGMDIDAHPRNSRAAIGVVPQEINMDPFFTPLEALDLQAGFYGVPKSERQSEEILAAVGLSEQKNAYVRQLSGGMKRRLMVAKAMVHRPPVLILDEPTAGVDVELRRQLWDYVLDLNRRGTTIILTTHYLEEAQELCDSIAIVNHGEVIACEPTPSLLKRLDHKSLAIHPKTPLTTIPDGLNGLNVALCDDGVLRITFRSSETHVGELLDVVKKTGLEIADLATEEPDLEDVFVALTSS